jgi:transcriptional regulator with XRE-family HTH domain
MLSKNIKKFRKQHKVSQEELAKKSGITYSTLIKIESGTNKNPTLETISKIASAFGISLDQLVGRR